MKVSIFMANGFEETEAIGVIDVLRRGDVQIDLISITDSLEVTSAHNVKITCDKVFKDMNKDDYDMIIFPGGVTGVENIRNFPPIKEVIVDFNNKKKYIGAICAGPVILGDAEILGGKNFTCYEGFEKFVENAIYSKQKVIIQDNIVTSNCVGSVFEFGLTLLSLLKGEEFSEEVRRKMILC